MISSRSEKLLSLKGMHEKKSVEMGRDREICKSFERLGSVPGVSTI